MQLKKLSGITLILLFLFLVTACKKDAGEGGLATIKGKVFANDLTSGGNMKDSSYLGNQRVFIAVAGNVNSFTDVRTNYDGLYEFQFLRKGDYEIWVYGNCDTCAHKQQYQVQKVTITDKKEVKILPDFRILI